MGRTIALCPECEAPVQPAIIQPPPAIYSCPSCGARMPRNEFKKTFDFMRATGGGSPLPPNEDEMAINHPFEFPFSGQMLTNAPAINLALTNGSSQVVFSQSGRGIIRNMAWITSATLNPPPTTSLANLTLEIRYDGNSTADVSIPLFALGGMEYARSAIADYSVSTPAFELGCTPFISTDPGVYHGCNGNFRLPLPFTNGIEVKVVAPATSDFQSIFFNTMWQNDLPQSAWNKRLRLYADRSNETTAVATADLFNYKITDSSHLQATSGSFPANIAGRAIIPVTISTSDMYVLQRIDSTHCLISSKDTLGATLNVIDDPGHYNAPVHRFLNRPAGESGYIAMVVGGYANNPDVDIQDEGNVRFFLNGNTEQDLQWTSTEDFAMGCFNFEQNERTEEGGITCKDTVTNFEKTFYRVFYKTPIAYTNGIVGNVPQYDTFAQSTFKWTTFYYKTV